MAEQLVLDLARVEPPTFRNFVAGPNREAVAALGRLADRSLPETGILLWGAEGVGKTHLLHGIVAAAGPHRPAFFCATPADVPTEPDRLPAGALVAIDDVDGASADDQARMFTLCNALAAHGGQWVAGAHLPPARMALRDDLRTRLALGLVFEVLPLSDADKPQALATYARERGFRLGDDVIGYLLAHGRRDMRSLVATLAALDRHSLATRRVVTVALLRDWLQRDLRL
ncbi:MAG: DnaA regulatory inactivator Hda [Candidatus Levyibacteriota bacterium]